MLWFFVLNISNAVYPTLTGGDYLLNQLLLFNCFIVSRAVSSSEIKQLFHNLASIAVMVQVCVVYVISALLKLQDEYWKSGAAIEMINAVNHYSMYNKVSFLSTPFVSKLVGFFIITYQLLFPLLVWFKRIKKPFLIIGILMHLYISFGLGLVSFGLIMIVCYSYFWPYKSKL